MTTRRQLSSFATAALVGIVLAGCGPADRSRTPSATASSSQTPATVTVTTIVTVPPTAPRPVPTKPTGPTIEPSPTTPPPAKDALPIPRSAQDYGIAFVTAWVNRDRAHATLLGTESAVKDAFAAEPGTAPRFQRCEGAAGSSYCTWVGTEYTLQLRILNETASVGQPHAVVEALVRH